MLTAPQIDPIAIQLGPLAIRWYGLMYLLAFLAFWWLGRRRARQTGLLKAEQIDDLLFYGALGVILGGRFGYVFFYGFEQLLADPLYLLRIWQGGMSFHGGLLGVLVAAWLFGRKHGLGFFGVTPDAAGARSLLGPLGPPLMFKAPAWGGLWRDSGDCPGGRSRCLTKASMLCNQQS